MDSNKRIPDEVSLKSKLLESLGIWHQICENPAVTSCRDAANKRYRLGNRGIPLKDELKSFFGRYHDESGNEKLVIAHCRADSDLDFEKLKNALRTKTKIERVSSAGSEIYGFGYGLVNPFIDPAVANQLNLTQVFDSSLTVRNGIPGTVTTNIGDRKWGVEIFADELISSLQNACSRIVVEDIRSHTSSFEQSIPLSIGIITGNSPESGMTLWRYVNKKIRKSLGDEFRGDISFPKILVHSVPEMGLSMELETRSEFVWHAIERSARQMFAQGVKVLGLACHTTQFFETRLQELAASNGARFVSSRDSLRIYCQQNRISQFGFIGGRQASSFAAWSAFAELKDDYQIETLSDKGRQYVHDLGYEIKLEGPSLKTLQKLQQVVKREFTTQPIIIGLTELSTIFEIVGFPKNNSTQLVDLLELVAHQMALESIRHLDC